jgi:hypothetical protein
MPQEGRRTSGLFYSIHWFYHQSVIEGACAPSDWRRKGKWGCLSQGLRCSTQKKKNDAQVDQPSFTRREQVRACDKVNN